MAIHMFVQGAFGFSYILFVATDARDQRDNILCCAVCVLPQTSEIGINGLVTDGNAKLCCRGFILAVF